jgi:hypothetical protein
MPEFNASVLRREIDAASFGLSSGPSNDKTSA